MFVCCAALMKIVSVLIYGMVFYPLFACLVLGSVFGYGLGALYVWMLTIVEIYQLTECPDLPAVSHTSAFSSHSVDPPVFGFSFFH